MVTYTMVLYIYCWWILGG